MAVEMDNFRELTLSYFGNNLLNNNDNDDNFIDKIKCTEEISSFSTEKNSSPEEIIGQMNQLISTRSSRCQGLILLRHVVKQCSASVFIKYAVTWSKMLLNVLGAHNTPTTLRLCCSALQDILQHVYKIPPLSHELGSSVVPSLVSVLLGATGQWQYEAYCCLAVCMTTFAGPCGPFKNKIETNVVGLIGNSSTAEKAAWKCYALLAGCGGGGSHSIKHTEAWAYYSDKVITSLHMTLDDLYSDLETDSYRKRTGGLNLPSVNSQDPDCNLILKRRFESLVGTFTQMLSMKFPAVVKLPIEDILEFICRTVALSPKTLLNRPTQERVVLASLLPFIHKSAFHLLSAVVLCCGSLLLPYTDVINRVIAQTLSWSSTAPDSSTRGSHRAFHDLRACVYATLSTWLATLGVSADMEAVVGDLIQQTLSDLTPSEPQHKKANGSTLSRQVTEIQSSKKRKQGSAASHETAHFSDHQKEDSLANETLCIEALKVLQQLVVTGSVLWDASHYKNIQNFTIGLLVRISQSACLPIPYSSSSCRLHLYRVLTSCVISPPSGYGAPSQVAMQLISTGCRDPDIAVSHVCQEALSVCTCIIHPRGPPLSVPAPSLNQSDTQAPTDSSNWWTNSPIKSRPSYRSETIVTDSPRVDETASEDDPTDPTGTLSQTESTGAESVDDSSSSDDDEAEKEVIEIEGSDVEEVEASDDVQITTVIPASQALQASDKSKRMEETLQDSSVMDGAAEVPAREAGVVMETHQGSDAVSEDTVAVVDEAEEEVENERGHKRALEEVVEEEAEKPAKKTAVEGGIAMEEMLACFVDADPDAD